MAEELTFTVGSKEEKYQTLMPQIKALIAGESDLVANTANVVAALRQTFGFFWVGFYFVKADELVLGPFQGEIACTRIAIGRGVCGTAWQNKETLIVPDVNKFEGHIACSAASQSEIVVPIIKDGTVRSLLDLDSDQKNAFDEVDQKYLENLAKIMAELF